MARRFLFLLLCCAFLFGAWNIPTAHADTDVDLELYNKQQDQRRAKENTDRIVRRIGTMLRVLDYYQVDQKSTQKMLSDVAETLSKLSEKQMTEVIRRLEVAARSTDKTKSEKEVVEAFLRHREILGTLETMLEKYKSLNSLAQVAGDLRKHAKQQFQLHLETGDIMHTLQAIDDPSYSAKQKGILRKKYRNPRLEKTRQALTQADLKNRVEGLLQKVQVLYDKLPQHELERLDLMKNLAGKQRLIENLWKSAELLKAGKTERSFDKWEIANNLQIQSAKDILALADILSTPPEMLSALREAKQQIEETLQDQSEIDSETKEQETKLNDLVAEMANTQPGQKPEDDKKKLVFPGTDPLPKLSRKEQRELKKKMKQQATAKLELSQKNQELGQKQAKLEYKTLATKNLVEPHAKYIADKIAKAAKEMEAAKKALKQNEPGEAKPSQQEATKSLENAKKDIERILAAHEKEKADPLLALKKALNSVDKLLKEQKDTREQTKDTVGDKQNVKLPQLAGKQKKLTGETKALKEQPITSKPAVQKALQKATDAMQKAAKSLTDKKSAEAVPKQTDAVKQLEDAKKALGEQIADIEKRREDIAKLEDAADKLAKLTKQETDLAKNTKKQADAGAPEKQDSKGLAKKQGEITPPTKTLEKELANVSPDASKKIGEGAKKMDEAKSNLDKSDLKPAATQTKDAAKKLADAQKAIAKKLEDLKGKEIADQAKMQPNKIDPASAAQQIAKAIEQTMKASEDAKQAADSQKQLPQEAQKTPPETKPGEQPKTGPQQLAKLQKDLAKKAGDFKLPEAQKDADKAADSLDKGDLKKAIDEQKRTLAKLQEAGEPTDAKPGQQQPMPQSPPKANQPKLGQAKPQSKLAGEEQKPGEAKKNLVKPGDAKQPSTKAGQPQLPQPKAGQPKAGPMKPGQKAGESKLNKANAADAKPGQPKPMVKPGQQKAGETKPGQKTAESKGNQPKAAQAKAGQPKSGQPKAGQPKAGQPKAGQPKAGQPKAGQPKAGQPKTGVAKAGQPKAGQPKAGQPKTGQAKAGMPKAGQAKAGDGKKGDAKNVTAQKADAKGGQAKAGDAKPGQAPMAAGQPKAAVAKSGQAKQGQAGKSPMPGQQSAAKGAGKSPMPGQAQTASQGKTGGQPASKGGLPSPSQAKSPTQLAQAQKAIMKATQALANSQQATQAAKALLDQAQPQAPQAVQSPLQQASQQLGKAMQQLQQGQAAKAGQAQKQAANQLQQALKAMNAALASMNQPQVQPGQMPTAVATGPKPPTPGQQPGQQAKAKPGQGTKPGQGQPKQPGEGQALTKKMSPGNEKKGKGLGNREPDGKVSNAKSQLIDVNGEGAFLHLPPRQRELIRQALSGELPPEFAAQIQQYFVNISRGRPAVMTGPGNR